MTSGPFDALPRSVPALPRALAALALACCAACGGPVPGTLEGVGPPVPAPSALPGNSAYFRLVVNGLPPGATGDVVLHGTDNNGLPTVAHFSQTTLVTFVPSGLTSITATPVDAGGLHYEAVVSDPEGLYFPLLATGYPDVTVTYAACTPQIVVEVSAPYGVPADATVTGPNGFSEHIVGSTLITPAALGTYFLTANTLVSNGSVYLPRIANASLPATCPGATAAQPFVLTYF